MLVLSSGDILFPEPFCLIFCDILEVTLPLTNPLTLYLSRKVFLHRVQPLWASIELVGRDSDLIHSFLLSTIIFPIM